MIRNQNVKIMKYTKINKREENQMKEKTQRKNSIGNMLTKRYNFVKFSGNNNNTFNFGRSNHKYSAR